MGRNCIKKKNCNSLSLAVLDSYKALFKKKTIMCIKISHPTLYAACKYHRLNLYLVGKEGKIVW